MRCTVVDEAVLKDGNGKSLLFNLNLNIFGNLLYTILFIWQEVKRRRIFTCVAYECICTVCPFPYTVFGGKIGYIDNRKCISVYSYHFAKLVGNEKLIYGNLCGERGGHIMLALGEINGNGIYTSTADLGYRLAVLRISKFKRGFAMVSTYTLDEISRTAVGCSISVLQTAYHRLSLINGYRYLTENLIIIDGIYRSKLDIVFFDTYSGLDISINPAVSLRKYKIAKSESISPGLCKLGVEFNVGCRLLNCENDAARALILVTHYGESAVSTLAGCRCRGNTGNYTIIGEVVSKAVNYLITYSMLLSVVNKGILKNNNAHLTLCNREDNVLGNRIITI